MTLKLKERDGHLHISGKFMGRTVRKSTGYTIGQRGQAEKALAKEITRIASITGTISVEEALETYKTKMEMSGKFTTNSGYMIEQWAKLTAGMSVEYLTPSVIEDIVSKNMMRLKPSSIRRKLNVLSAAINLSARLKRCEPIKIMMPKVDDARDSHLNIEEIRDFLAWIEDNAPDYLFVFTLLIDSGLRLNEMRKLRWRDIDEDKILVRHKVNGKTRTRSVPLSRRLRAQVDKNRGAPSALCFEGKGGGEWTAASVTLGKVLRRWTTEVGIDDFRVHDLRHTFAWQCAFHGCDLGELQMLMGHANIAMTMRYRGFIMSKAKGVINEFD
jgi:integrase